MKRLAIILAAAGATLSTVAITEAAMCRELSGAWTAYLARGKTTGNYHVIDTIIKLHCYALPPTATDTLCLWDHSYRVSYQYKPGSNLWPVISTPKADHTHGIWCTQNRAVLLERSQLGTICGPRPGTPIEVVDYLWDGPAPLVNPLASNQIIPALRVKCWRFRCPPLVAGPGPGTTDGIEEEDPEP